jgi:hypothetical protein
MSDAATFCQTCGAPLVDGAAFCQQCGHPVGGGRAGRSYPATFEAEYPEQLGRLSTAFRIILFVPVAIFLALVSGEVLSYGDFDQEATSITLGGGGVVLAIWAAVLVRQYVPHWMFDFQVALMRFQARAYGYLALLTDRFPAFEGEYPIDFDVRYPDKLSRWRVAIWKIISSIPHFIILIFLYVAAVVVVIIAWFAILFTGRYPKGLHTFVAGVFRWSLRVEAYILSLTDEYPPFSLD